VAQLNKWREQDKEDIKGLNIALDSKQQELESLKRKIGVRGTAGNTPALVPRKRESSMFNTPSVIRPPSALSDGSKDGGGKEKKPAETPDPVKTLTKSVRVNGPTMNRMESSMGGPPSAARKFSGLARTPSKQSSIHSRSGSTTLPSSTPTPKPAGHQRKVSNLDPMTPARPKTSPSPNGSRSGGSSPTPNEKENDKSLAPTKATTLQTAKRTAMPA